MDILLISKVAKMKLLLEECSDVLNKELSL